MPVVINFLANTSGFLRGTADTERALEQVGNSLDDMARDGTHATDKLEAGFKDLAAASKRDDIGGHIGKSMRHGTEEASEGVKTLKENTASNLKEVAASFDGTAQGAADGFQGLIAEVAEGFGPAGLIAGALAAGALGLITSQIQAGDEASKQWKQDVADLAGEFIDTGANGERSIGAIAEALKGMATATDGNVTSLSQVREQARTLGLPFKELARVYAEGGDATDYAIRKTKALIQTEQERLINAQAESGTMVTLNSHRLGQLEDQRKRLEDVRRKTREAAQEERDWLEAGGDQLERKSTALDSYAESVQSALTDAGVNWDDFAKKEGGLSLEDYADMLESKLTAVEDYQTNLVEVSRHLSEDGRDYLISLGEQAAPMLEKYRHANSSTQARLRADWDRAGRSSGRQFANNLKEELPNRIKLPGTYFPESAAREAYESLRRRFEAMPALKAKVEYSATGPVIRRGGRFGQGIS